MVHYNKELALFYIHIPKCAGVSLNDVLKKWYGNKFYRHNFNKERESFTSSPHTLKSGICISGHFNRKAGRGIYEAYPNAKQLITFLRDPFEHKLSQYYFWKKRRREYQIRHGIIEKGDHKDYKDINDFLSKSKKSYLLNFFPRETTHSNYKDVIKDKFIFIGIIEELQSSLNVLAQKLGFPSEKVNCLNSSKRDEVFADGYKEQFIENNELEYRIYNYVLDLYS